MVLIIGCLHVNSSSAFLKWLFLHAHLHLLSCEIKILLIASHLCTCSETEPRFPATKWPSWSWSYGSWIYNYLYNQCLSHLKLWVRVRSWQGVLDTTLCDKVLVSYLRQGSGFLRIVQLPPPIKLTAILLRKWRKIPYTKPNHSVSNIFVLLY